MKHIVIVTGGYLNIEFADKYLKTLSYDKVFAVDKGLEYVHALGIQPDYIVGDFDTVNIELLEEYERKLLNGEASFVIEKHSPVKDASDTELAFFKALEEGAEKITLLASTGSRMDHVLVNMGILLNASQKRVFASMIDENNRITLLNSDGISKCIIRRKEQYGTYLSVIPMTAKVEGLTMTGVRYPLDRYKLLQGSSLTVSNEIIDEEAAISIEKGNLFVIESMD